MRASSHLLSLAFGAALAISLSLVPNEAHATFFDCQIDSVGEVTASYGPRIHVHCANSIALSGQTIRYLAIASSSSAAQRFMSVLTAAMLAGKRVRFDVHASSAGGTVGGIVFPPNVAGCGGGDCRTPISWDLQP